MVSFRTVHQFGRDEIVINKSKFIGSVSPVKDEEEAIEFIEKIRKEFRDASHHVYAYSIGENKGIQRFTDDGEPSGTAGMPVLSVINNEDLRNIVVVVTRYYGGVNLGAGGLVRAYIKGAKIGIDNGLIVDKVKYNEILVNIEYTLLGKIENELSKNKFIIKDKIFKENVLVNILCKDDDLNKLNDIINEITSGKAEINMGQSIYYSIKEDKIIE